MIWRIKHKIKQLPAPEHIESDVFDIKELHKDCTVQVLKNSITGQISVGWWPNEEEGHG